MVIVIHLFCVLSLLRNVNLHISICWFSLTHCLYCTERLLSHELTWHMNLRFHYKWVCDSWKENRPNKEDGTDHAKYLQRQIRGDGSNNYLQLGWLDGVGMYRSAENLRSNRSGCCGGEENPVHSKLAVWENDCDVQAFDHLPLRAVVQVFSKQAWA